MTKKEEMKDLLIWMTGGVKFTSEQATLFREIIALIEKWFEMQERAAYELANIALGKESNGERILSALRLLEEVRDFGHGEKEGSGE